MARIEGKRAPHVLAGVGSPAKSGAHKGEHRTLAILVFQSQFGFSLRGAFDPRLTGLLRLPACLQNNAASKPSCRMARQRTIISRSFKGLREVSGF